MPAWPPSPDTPAPPRPPAPARPAGVPGPPAAHGWQSGRVHAPLVATVVTAGLLLALAGALVSLLDRTGRTADRVLLLLAGVAEAAVVVQSGVAAAGLIGGHDVRSTPTFVAYLVGNAAVLPFAFAWAWADRNRWSGAVIAIGGVTVAVMTGRLVMMWQGRA